LDFVTTSNALVFALYFSIGNSPRKLGVPSRLFPASALWSSLIFTALGERIGRDTANDCNRRDKTSLWFGPSQFRILSGEDDVVFRQTLATIRTHAVTVVLRRGLLQIWSRRERPAENRTTATSMCPVAPCIGRHTIYPNRFYPSLQFSGKARDVPEQQLSRSWERFLSMVASYRCGAVECRIIGLISCSRGFALFSAFGNLRPDRARCVETSNDAGLSVHSESCHSVDSARHLQRFELQATAVVVL